MQRSTRRKLNRPVGDCYRLAGRIVITERDASVLVHGTIWAPNLKRRISHAWIELPAGLTVTDETGDSETLKAPAIYDPAQHRKKMRLLPKWIFEKLMQPEEHARYTWQQAATKVVNTTHWGPWEKTLT